MQTPLFIVEFGATSVAFAATHCTSRDLKTQRLRVETRDLTVLPLKGICRITTPQSEVLQQFDFAIEDTATPIWRRLDDGKGDYAVQICGAPSAKSWAATRIVITLPGASATPAPPGGTTIVGAAALPVALLGLLSI